MVDFACGIFLLFYTGFHLLCQHIKDANINRYDDAMKCPSENVDEMCSICIENLNTRKNILKVKCGHMFHKECIDKWTASNKTCPNCMSIIMV